MRKVFYGFTVVLLISVLAQFYLSTFGAFERPVPAPGAEGAMIEYHVLNGELVIPILSLLTTVVAAIARVGGRLIWLSITPFLLVAVQLFVIFSLAEMAGAAENETTTAGLVVLGFHALDGVAILWAAFVLLRRAHALAKGVAATTPATARVTTGG